MGNCLLSTRTAYVKPKRKSMARKGRRRVKLEDLPEDVLHGILSKLPVEEVVRTSVLSSQWRHLWIGCPKLSFSDRFWCSRWERVQRNTQKFVDCVNAVLRQHSGKGVEELQVKCSFENKLADHLDNLIHFAIFSHTKNLAIDFSPCYRDDLCILPSTLFDMEGASCLRCLQVSFVCIKPPSQFLGFSNLRVLELGMFNTTRKDLEDLLCNCCNLEWLTMVKCYLRDELIVVRPLPRLQYLRIAHCNDITKIELHAAKLSIFVYIGECIPIALHHASKLENAEVRFFLSFKQDVTTVVLNGIPEVQRLTLQFALHDGKTWMLGSTHMFSRLRHVQLLVSYLYETGYINDKMLYLLSFLRATPVIEKLEVHFEDILGVWFRKSGSFGHEVLPCEYKHLKSMYVSGFLAASFQVEFITHIVENAPVIEAVTIDTDRMDRSAFRDLPPQEKITPAYRRAALDTVSGPLLERLPLAKLLLR